MMDGLNNYIYYKHYELIDIIPGNIYQLKILRLCAPTPSANVCKYGRSNSTQWWEVMIMKWTVFGFSTGTEQR